MSNYLPNPTLNVTFTGIANVSNDDNISNSNKLTGSSEILPN